MRIKTIDRSSGWFAWNAALVAVLAAASSALGQDHQLLNSRQPVGEIGRLRVTQRPDLIGIFQPVLLKAPKDSVVSFAEGGAFATGSLGTALVGLQVGESYRFRVSNIPNHFSDVYPTVELIDRMHAPPGKETRYPIPIDLTQEELAMAISGKFVTRVIYVEDPRNALGVRDLPEQRYFEVMAHEDPLHVASNLGRPVAILRMGSLAPGPNGPSDAFLFGSPPVLLHAPPVPKAYVPSQHPPAKTPSAPTPESGSALEQEAPEQGEATITDPESSPAEEPVVQAAPAETPDNSDSPSDNEPPQGDDFDLSDEPLDEPAEEDDPFSDFD